jgi:hypothetical protein
MQVVKTVGNNHFLDNPEGIQAFEPPCLDRWWGYHQECCGA